MATDAKKGRASLVEIQNWWKVPSIAHFCSLFRTKFGLPDFEIEELEEALITDTEEDPSYFLKNLLARILFGCYGKRDIGVTTYDRYLRDIMKTRWEIEESRVNPLNIEDTTFHSLPTLSKVEVLHSLCDYRLDAEDVSELLKGTIAEHMRIEPLGSDSEGAKYWYFYGTRLYKEAKKLTKAEKDELRKKREKEKRKKRREKAKERAKEKEKLKMIKMAKKNADHQAAEDSQNDSCAEEQGQETPTTSTTVSSESDSDDDLEPPRWHIVCNTMEDWEELAAKFKKTKSKNEKELYRALANDFLPVMVDLYNQKEKALRKKLLEMAPRRTSGRIQEKKQNVVEDEYEEFIIGEENEEEEEDKFATNERRQRNRQYRKEMQELEEQEAIKRKEEEEERAKLAKEDRARRVQLREERAQLIAEGKPIPRELKNPSPVPTSSRPKRVKKMVKSSCEQNRDEEFDALYISMHKVLDALKRDTNSWPFLEPVSEEVAPKYYEFIKKPMDISTIEQNLDNKKYQNKLEFVDDVHLMFENCETYNGTESEYTEMAQALEVVFTRMMLKCFPEDDMDFLEDDFFMSEQCKPRRSGRTVKDTLGELDENVFGSFREDDSSDENQSEDDCYHPTNKKIKMNSPVSKRPQRVPRVNYTGDDLKDDSKDDMRRVHAFRNFYSNRASFNADPMYGVTCSHMSVMRVVDGKIIEERGPAVRPTSQTALSAKDVKNLSDDGENKDNEKPSTVGIPVPSGSGLDVTQEDTELVKKEDAFKTEKTQNNEQLKSDDIIVNKVKSGKRGRIAKKEKSPKAVDTEDGIKNNLSSFMKHPKVRSKKERLKEAETVPVVSLPTTIFTPTSVSKAVPALLSKGNHLKQEMKMIAVDGEKIKNEDKLLSTSLFKYNGPKSPKQTNVNLDFDRNMSPSHKIKHRQKSPHKTKSPPSQRLKSSPEKVAELGVKKGVKQSMKSTLNFDSTTIQNHSISGSTKFNHESSDVSTILPINSDQLNYSKNDALHSVDGSGDQIRTFSSEKQEDSQTVIQERASVITFLPNSVAPESAGDACSKNIASDLKIQKLDNQTQSLSATCSQYNVKNTQEENSNDNSAGSDQKVCNAKTLTNTNNTLPSDYEEIYNKTVTPSISSNPEPLLPSIASGPHGHTEMCKPPILQAEISNTLPPTDQQIVYTPPNLEAQISNTLPHKQDVYTPQNLGVQISNTLPHKQEVYTPQNLGVQISNTLPHKQEVYTPQNSEVQIPNTLPNADQQEVCTPRNLEAQPPKSNHQEVYTPPNLETPPSNSNQQEVFTPSNLETPHSSNLEAPPSKSEYQEVYHSPNLEAQPSNSDLKDLIDIDALQEKNPRPAPVNPRPTASPTPLLPLNSNKTFNTTSLMMNRVLLPNSLTINHMDSLQAHNSFNQFKGMPTTYQPSQQVQSDQRYLPHASGTLQHSTATLQHPITMVQGVETQKAGIRQQYTAHQYPQATTSNLLQFSDAMQPYQQISQPYTDANQHHPGTHSAVAGLQQQKATLINPGASHRPGMPQHTLSLPQSSMHQPVLSNVPAGQMQGLQQQSAPEHNWDHRQQSYQTQPVFQVNFPHVGAQANVSMPQTYQMSIPGHPSLQNGSYPPT